MDRGFEAFFKANEDRIHFQIHRLGITGDWYDEFYAEGIFALWKAYQGYKPSQGEFGTFLNYQIRYRLMDLLRKKMREAELDGKAAREVLTRIDEGNRHRGSGVPVATITGIVLEDKAFWEEVRGRLTENQWKWVQYFIIADLSIKEIMELENVSADAVKSWGREVRRKLGNEEVRRKLEEMV
ncbi:sigma-70 family RNA polymerase sigma factor [Pseudogracilibacillus auburnensis]|uniref:RNA polymerase sigma factor (Sigma-70 family) n=1 Tax=Pseudogracilibacillus auburnensis TaxID=1494959 RepID=A0A2V3VNI0_9BACI|nr:sigma-70 family RNA polymerase sigma factor [Pseudogracilibacillus auburnensis]MBO1001801.1 sigma-70 family RNA polymerase sigma factor [Pseudogracilibacillus auburnensis]PXW83413.1 RNA polymerase sigma factor (sigma-70 family) [Pseudogracilibacillus auburnensis]